MAALVRKLLRRAPRPRQQNCRNRAFSALPCISSREFWSIPTGYSSASGLNQGTNLRLRSRPAIS